MNAVAINREPFTDPRPATVAQQLTAAERRADAAYLRMKAAMKDMANAHDDILRGDDDGHSALAIAVAEYRNEYGRLQAARDDQARLRREASR